MCICPINVNKSKEQIIIISRALWTISKRAEKSERSKWHEITVKWKLCDGGGDGGGSGCGAWVIVIYTRTRLIFSCSFLISENGQYFLVGLCEHSYFSPVWFNFHGIYHIFILSSDRFFVGEKLRNSNWPCQSRYTSIPHVLAFTKLVTIVCALNDCTPGLGRQQNQREKERERRRKKELYLRLTLISEIKRKLCTTIEMHQQQFERICFTAIFFVKCFVFFSPQFIYLFYCLNFKRRASKENTAIC